MEAAGARAVGEDAAGPEATGIDATGLAVAGVDAAFEADDADAGAALCVCTVGTASGADEVCAAS